MVDSQPNSVALHGLMQEWPLTLDRIIDHAARWHGDREVVSRQCNGEISRTTYREVRRRARRLSNALKAFGIRRGDRVATLAFNSSRHFEAWYGIMGIGAVCHTLNPRLFREQLIYIVNHAQDRVILADIECASIVEALRSKCPSIERVILFDAAAYEELLAGQSDICEWGGFDERLAAGLCYTSGTTGEPKGVLYSHRSNFLHTLLTLQSDMLGLSARDVVLPIVPMFHANAWGLAFSAPAVGAKLVMPGSKLDGASIFELLETERVTFAAGVPTVWQSLLQYLDERAVRLSSVKRIVVGGSACPEALIRRFWHEHGVEVAHAWGMTEISPIGTVSGLPAETAALPFEEQVACRLKQGRAPVGVELKLADDENRELPHDGTTFGRLKVRGAAVASAYFRGTEAILDENGFFDTGDVATIDPAGCMHIVDRSKDVIKSGGEWISSVEIESLAASHPKAALAAAVGVPDPKWGERPILLVKLKAGCESSKEEFLRFLEGRIARWCMPDDVRFVDEMPLTATGKLDKKLIRARLEGS
jgi:fatty-acyl-CoA synthase